MAPNLSIVVPCYNEEDSIQPFLHTIVPVLESIGRPYEVIFVDDGSGDLTFERLRQASNGNRSVRAISLSRNFGKEAALSAGLMAATGDAVIPIDVDLQDPPHLIPEMIAAWESGYDVVLARRVSRAVDTSTKRLTAGIFYRLYNAISKTPLPENVGDFRLMDRRVVDALGSLPETDRFMKGLFAWVGFRTTYVNYDRAERAAGETKWNYWKLWNFALDGITSFTTLPLRIWSYFGVALAVISAAYGIYIVIRTIIFGIDVPGYASMFFAVLFIGGVQLIGLGIIGEYLGRTYHEVKRRPLYVVRDRTGFDEE